MRKLVSLLVCTTLLTGCATWHSPVPENYAGPTVELSDTGFQESGAKGQFFVVTEIDGNRIYNSIFASGARSRGHGFSLTSEYISRKVPVKPQKVKLKGTHETAAPIHAMFSQLTGTFFEVEGEVQFNPVKGHSYQVKGELKKEGSSIWIEDAATKEPVTEKIQSKKE